MFTRSHEPRVTLKLALSRYWPYLSGLVLFVVVAVFSPNFSDRSTFFLGMFFVSALVAMYPWLYRDAPYMFWNVACISTVGLFAALIFARHLIVDAIVR
jgi:Na+/serine symporter